MGSIWTPQSVATCLQVPADKGDVTSRQIAGHLAGFRHYGKDDYVNSTYHANVDEVLPRLLGMPLLDRPEARYAYSSYGFNVLGAVLQRVAQKEYRQLVSDEVLTPLGLTHTVAEASPIPSERARLYTRDPQGQLIDATASDLTDRWPSGGFLSTAEDLARFGTAILQPTFLSVEARESAFTSQRDGDGKETGVGLGWRVAHDASGRRYVHHGGEALGGRAFILVYPDAAVAVALVTNVGFAAIAETEALELAQSFLP